MHKELCPQQLRKDIGDAHKYPCTCFPDRELFWLVERAISPPQYVSNNSAGWHGDVWQARRFKTEREAHDYWRMMGEIDRQQFKVVEHLFINKMLSTPEQLAETSKFMSDNGL